MLQDGLLPSLRGLMQLQWQPARLLTDFTITAGTGAALLNASLVAGIGLAISRVSRVRISGPVIAAVLTMFGFGLFGKTPLNAVPIIAGVWIASRMARRNFAEYLLIALFGTALGPVVTFLLVETGVGLVAGIVLATVGGLLSGVVLPAMAMLILRLHQGFSLYNMGYTTGFVALMLSGLVLFRSGDTALLSHWNSDPDSVLRLLVPAGSAVLLLASLASGPRSVILAAWKISRTSGRLPSDYVDSHGLAATGFNMGLLGLGFSGLVLATGAPFNGPVLGGLLTVIGFAAFGKHLRNVTPVVAGVLAAILAFGAAPADPVAILALLFCTTLAPLSGEFGPLAGFGAGVLHFAIVRRAAAWHIGLGLYNNGLAGGMAATLIVALIEWYRSSRETEFRRAP